MRDAVERLREVPNTLSEWAQDIARKLGRRIYNPNSLDYQMRQATEVAHAYNQSRGWDVPHRNQGRGR